MSRLSCRRLLRGEALNERERDNRPGWAPLFQYRHRQWRAAVVGSFVLRLHLFCPPSSFTYPLSIVGMACLRIAGHLPLAKKRAAAQLNKHWHTSVTTVDDAGNRRCSSAKNGSFSSSPANENRSMDSRIVRASHMPQMRRFLTSCLPKRHTCAF